MSKSGPLSSRSISGGSQSVHGRAPIMENTAGDRGDVIYKAGQRDLGLTIVLRGEVEVFEQRDGTEQTASPGDI